MDADEAATDQLRQDAAAPGEDDEDDSSDSSDCISYRELLEKIHASGHLSVSAISAALDEMQVELDASDAEFDRAREECRLEGDRFAQNLGALQQHIFSGASAPNVEEDSVLRANDVSGTRPTFLTESDAESIKLLNRIFDETSLREYLHDGRLVNDELRKEHRKEEFEYDAALVDAICAALSRCHSYEGLVWRGQSDSDRSRWYKEMLISSLQTGEPFEDPAFLSTSAKTLNENTRYACKKVWIQIQSKTGKFVQPYASCAEHRSEFEVLFCRGTKFQTIHHECSEEEVGGVREEKEKFIVEEVEPSPFLVKHM